jgi:hypothetical protein
MRHFRSSSNRREETWAHRHRPEHWYRDQTVYFITARCKDKFPAFASERAKQIFWECFERYTKDFRFVPWVTTLMNNHYHSEGFLYKGENLGKMMQRLHGSVAKLVNDTLPVRLLPFWRDRNKLTYFDGCLRDEKQGRLTYRYVLNQSVRHGICRDYRLYPHTRLNVELEPAIRRAIELNAFMTGVRYPRYGR